jgi:hypothetical protein
MLGVDFSKQVETDILGGADFFERIGRLLRMIVTKVSIISI